MRIGPVKPGTAINYYTDERRTVSLRVTPGARQWVNDIAYKNGGPAYAVVDAVIELINAMLREGAVSDIIDNRMSVKYKRYNRSAEGEY